MHTLHRFDTHASESHTHTPTSIYTYIQARMPVRRTHSHPHTYIHICKHAYNQTHVCTTAVAAARRLHLHGAFLCTTRLCTDTLIAAVVDSHALCGSRRCTPPHTPSSRAGWLRVHVCHMYVGMCVCMSTWMPAALHGDVKMVCMMQIR